MSFTVLFLCTGNYYRSRFAEILFNTLASREHLEARAISRGMATELGVDNIGPISTHTLEELKRREIEDHSTTRFPLQVQDQDFRNAQLVIALDEEEHRTMMQARYPVWADKIEYWNVADLWAIGPDKALPAIEKKVRHLIDRLKPQT